MNAMILGAGRGTRLGEIGLSKAKIMMDIGGAPLLQRQLDYLQKEGVDRVVVNASHLSEQIQAFAGAYTGGVQLTVSVESELLGTAGGVRHALEFLGDEPFFVLYGDVMTDEPLAGMTDSHRDAGALITLGVYRSDQIADKGVVMIDADGYVERFVEKDPEAVGPAFINAGLYVVEPEPLREWEDGTVFDFGFDYFPWVLEQRGRIFTHALRSPVIDIGTPAGLEAGRCRFLGR